jgi:hypothetical protein
MVSAGSRIGLVCSYFSIDVAKLVTQPFCDAMLATAFDPDMRWLGFGREVELAENGSTYVALQGALEDELLSHIVVLPGIQKSVEEW